MANLLIQDIMRTAYVDRWQIVRALRTQNIAEHSYMVCMISLELAKTLFKEPLDDRSKVLIMDWALRHDIPELVSGDLATPVKQRIKKLTGADFFDNMEKEICSICYQSKQDAGELFQSIVKLADYIDGIHFLELEGHGKHAKYVLEKIKSVFLSFLGQCKRKYPDLEWYRVTLIYQGIMDDECSYLNFEEV